MRLPERLARQGQEIQNRRRREADSEEEETMLYQVRNKSTPLNDRRDVFSQSDQESLNVKKNIFDRTALFHTEDKEGGSAF